MAKLIFSIEEAAQILLNDGIIAVPTETVYGLAALATSQKAVEKVYAAKQRPKDNPLICHFSSIDQILKYGVVSQHYLPALIEKFSPGPISYLLNLSSESPLHIASRGLSSIIVRIPNHPTFLELIKRLDKPIAAPSANTSGRVSPTNEDMVQADLGDKIDAILSGGSSSIGLESTILDCRDSKVAKIMRPGVIGYSELLPILLPFMVKVEDYQPENHVQIPGNRYKHYSPNTPLYISENLYKHVSDPTCAILLTTEELKEISSKNTDIVCKILVIGSIHNLDDIARNIYERLATIDTLEVEKAYMSKQNWGFSSTGIALENRITKAGLINY